MGNQQKSVWTFIIQFSHKFSIPLVWLSCCLSVLLRSISFWPVIFIYQGMSDFEKHSNLNEKYESRILKGFLLLYLMTCALTIFINLRLNLGNGTYLGDFDDFTPNWFKTVGYSLGLTLATKIFAAIGFAIFGILRKCMATEEKVSLKRTKDLLPQCSKNRC